MQDTVEPEDALLYRLRHLEGGTLAALLCGTAAFALAGIPPLSFLSPLLFLTKPLSFLGLMIALVGSVLPAIRDHGKWDIPLGVAALCLIVFLFVGSWPSFRGPPAPPILAVALRPDATSAIRPIEEGEWVDASTEAMQMKDMRVEVLGARVGIVNLIDGKKKKPRGKEKFLVIQLRVSYHGALFREIPYEPWADLASGPSKHAPTLSDDRNQLIPQKIFDLPWKVEGRLEVQAMLPGHMVKEVLVFSPPAQDVQYLRLSLPASAFGSTGEFRFQIPRSMILFS